jgi:anti-sigma B factor antagonist
VTPFELTRRDTGDSESVVVDVAGELDLTNASEVEARLEALGPPPGANLVLDLNRVVFIDSAALHVLFRTARRLGKDRFTVLLEPNAAIARTISIVGMGEVTTIERSTPEPPPE